MNEFDMEAQDETETSKLANKRVSELVSDRVNMGKVFLERAARLLLEKILSSNQSPDMLFVNMLY